MPGLGTIVNAAAIVAAGVFGTLAGSKIPKRIQESLMTANALAVIFLGIGGVMAQMLRADGAVLSTQGTIMMTLSLAIGAVIGELLNIEDKFEIFGEWLKKKTGNAKDEQFVNAFVNASLTVCIGAMAIIGSIQDGISADPSILFTKAVMDFVIILIMSASLGKGCGFSAIPVAIFQGLITLLARLLRPLVTDAAMANLSYIGSILICCVGINLFFGKKVRVANFLPSLIIAIIFAFL